jgi:hypothetical protein
MWKRIGAGAAAGLGSGLLIDLVTSWIMVATPRGGHLSILASVADAVRVHGRLGGALVTVSYGVAMGAVLGWLCERRRRSEGPQL